MQRAEEDMIQAVRTRDATADGRFFYAVLTTGIFCYPSCAARPARPENLRFFATAEAASQAGYRPCLRCRPDLPPRAERDARMQWWRDARFGMFIHWGVYAVPAQGEWYMTNAKVPIAAYEKFATQFDPKKFDADKIAATAQAAGQKYLVITAKHHDGFCMFKTATTKYNDHPTYNPTSFRTPESNVAYVAYMKAQLKELITNYHPALIWFVGEWAKGWGLADGKDLTEFLYKLDPKLIIHDPTTGGGDYGTPE